MSSFAWKYPTFPLTTWAQLVTLSSSVYVGYTQVCSLNLFNMLTPNTHVSGVMISVTTAWFWSGIRYVKKEVVAAVYQHCKMRWYVLPCNDSQETQQQQLMETWLSVSWLSPQQCSHKHTVDCDRSLLNHMKNKHRWNSHIMNYVKVEVSFFIPQFKLSHALPKKKKKCNFLR